MRCYFCHGDTGEVWGKCSQCSTYYHHGCWDIQRYDFQYSHPHVTFHCPACKEGIFVLIPEKNKLFPIIGETYSMWVSPDAPKLHSQREIYLSWLRQRIDNNLPLADAGKNLPTDGDPPS